MSQATESERWVNCELETAKLRRKLDTWAKYTHLLINSLVHLHKVVDRIQKKE